MFGKLLYILCAHTKDGISCLRGVCRNQWRSIEFDRLMDMSFVSYSLKSSDRSLR